MSFSRRGVLSGGDVPLLVGNPPEKQLRQAVLRSSAWQLTVLGLVVVAVGLGIGALVVGVQARDNTNNIYQELMTPPVTVPPVKRDLGPDMDRLHEKTNNIQHHTRTVESKLDIIYNELRGIVDGQVTPKIKCGNQDIDADSDCFDVIIVGGGAAGVTAARKISDNYDLSVLLIEAGDDYYEDMRPNETPPPFQFPGCSDGPTVKPIKQTCIDPWSGNYKQRYGYFRTTKDDPFAPLDPPGNGFFALQDLEYQNGRVLGGGTSINGFQNVRGTQSYWSRVQAAAGGDASWSPTNIYDIMKSQESFNGQAYLTPGPTRGTSGLISSTVRPALLNDNMTNFADSIAFAASTVISGFSPDTTRDYNAPAETVGVYRGWQMSQKHETPTFDRETSDQAFLGPTIMDRTSYLGIGGRRLSVRVKKTAKSLLWDALNTTRCVGVEYVENIEGGIQRVIYAWARKTVVLSQNIFTAQMLQRNGIGPVATLADAGVPVRVANEHVGRHLQTHMGAIFFGITFVGKPDYPPFSNEFVPGNIYGQGPAVFFPDASSTNTTERGVEMIVLPAFPADENDPTATPTVFVAAPFHLNPTSEGTIDIQSDDPEHNAIIGLNPLSTAQDKLSWQKNVEQIATILDGRAGTILFTPFNVSSEAETYEYVRQNYVITHHWVGAARIGTSAANGVVDSRLRVFGVDGLRVCDTMVLPVIPDGNTQIPAYAVGDLCGQFILEDIAASSGGSVKK